MNELRKILPPDLESWVEARVARGDYVDAGDFIRDLVRREQRAEAEDSAWVREKIAEGEESGYLEQDAREVLKKIRAKRPDG